MTLPVNIDSTYGDDAGDASVKAHQQHHDAVHAFVNSGGRLVTAPTFTVEGTDPTVDTLVQFTVPAGFQSETGGGDVFSIVAEDGTKIFQLDTWADLYLRSPTGSGDFIFQVSTADKPGEMFHYSRPGGVVVVVGDDYSPTGNVISLTHETSGQIWSVSADGAMRGPTAIGMHLTAGVPDSALGADSDWALSDNGHIYFKASGSWTVKV